MIFGIASYRRPECRTIKTLLEIGVKREEIFISTQSLEDYNDYKKKWPQLQILYRETDCAAGNRNTILENINSDCVLLDDDISSFCKSNLKGFHKADESVIQDLQKLFKICKTEGITAFGFAPTTDNRVCLRREETTTNCVLQGSIIGICDNRVRFNENYKMAEDYELSLRIIRSGGKTLRANRLSLYKPKNGTNKGGMFKRYESGELPRYIKMLSIEYPNFKPNKNFTSGVYYE